MANEKLKYFIPALIWALIIFIVSSIPSLSTPTFGIRMFDKLAHFGEYFIFALLVSFAIGKQPLGISKTFWISTLIAGLYGFFDEFHQLFVTGRDASGLDALADLFGGASASGIYFLWKKKNKSKSDS